MEEKRPVVYILANRRNGTLYVGVTSNLIGRMWQHRNDVLEGFTRRHGVHRLVYFEQHDSIASATMREKQIKQCNRVWELRLIEKGNPDWRDLWPEICD